MKRQKANIILAAFIVIHFSGFRFKVDEAEAKLVYTVMCVFFYDFFHHEQDIIHFHHIKGLLSSLMEILLHSSALGPSRVTSLKDSVCWQGCNKS